MRPSLRSIACALCEVPDGVDQVRRSDRRCESRPRVHAYSAPMHREAHSLTSTTWFIGPPAHPKLARRFLTRDSLEATLLEHSAVVTTVWVNGVGLWIVGSRFHT